MNQPQVILDKFFFVYFRAPDTYPLPPSSLSLFFCLFFFFHSHIFFFCIYLPFLSISSHLYVLTSPLLSTKGLDSSTSYAVIKALQAVSRKGSNVIVVLHQPSYQIYEMFDDVIFLARGGNSVYVGPASGAMAYFSNTGFKCPSLVNPAGRLCCISL